MGKTVTMAAATVGHAEGGTPLNAFDNALLAAGIGNINLVKVSSIIPPFNPGERKVPKDLQDCIANIYLHTIWCSDDDRALHDHPWPRCSIIVDGGYTAK